MSRIMKSVWVRRYYEIEIDLTIDCDQLGVTHPGSLRANNMVEISDIE